VSDPVSWLLIEPGWEVVDSAGERLGTVHEVLGDEDADIFDGLAVRTSALERSYVPAERVKTITEGRIALDVDADDFDGLAERAERLEPGVRTPPPAS
jgi:uncharacterized protein YrrD